LPHPTPATKHTHAIVALAAVAVSLTLASTATAQETKLSGQTSDGVAVKLTVGEFGNATAFRVAAHKVDCNRGVLTNNAATYDSFDRSDPGAFETKSQGSNRADGVKFKTALRLTGTAAEDSLSWSGTYKVTTKVIRNGRKIDTCKVNATWDAA